MGRDDVGSKLSAASGRRSEVSEWPRSKLGASAARQRGNFGHRNRGIIPYGNATRAAVKRGVEDAAPPTRSIYYVRLQRAVFFPALCNIIPATFSPPFFPQKGLTTVFFWHTISMLKDLSGKPKDSSTVFIKVPVGKATAGIRTAAAKWWRHHKMV